MRHQGKRRCLRNGNSPSLRIIHRLDSARRAQFLISTHSPILLAYPQAVLLSLDGDAIRAIRYKEADHYQVTKERLMSPERYFKPLFAPDPGEES